jgi:putative tricarboxylic transport membrane protein
VERVYGIVVFCLGLAILWEGRSLSFGSFRNPGSGMFPDLIAILMLVLSAILIAMPPKKESREAPVSGKTVVLISSAFVSLVLYAIFLDFLGFLIASFLLSVFLFGVFDSGTKYGIAVFKALILTGLAYVLFEIVLKSNLPKGLLNF